jgi:putative NADH-flavin reductase
MLQTPVEDILNRVADLAPGEDEHGANERILVQVSQAHSDEFIVMVVDGAGSHRSQELRIPENIRLHRLPGYSPELNPQEHVWDELREKELPNWVFESMAAVVSQLEVGLPRMAANTRALRSLTAWPWILILSLILKAK